MEPIPRFPRQRLVPGTTAPEGGWSRHAGVDAAGSHRRGQLEHG